ncbi:multidrug transporter [Phototrophicus methaneseepsis]|uniref:Multidrug transporter n=1 Tax=Phototrophicus methaneseepsis TaxID=2710758 RepID=A0A7S8E8C7_9CHLR|nr:DapH/DapD/GlmU-related protein [Phototrophicus methaneseepsis]QPC82202.1 multidrug transporter [Phototrophicus methaneseepsis]
MYRYFIEDKNHVPPFNEPASLLTIGTRPLKLHQEELVAAIFGHNIELGGVLEDINQLRMVQGESVVYRDNLWFDREFFEYFIKLARASGRACQAAFPADDKAYRTYVVPLAQDITRSVTANGQPVYLLQLWYFPHGYTDDIMPIVIPSDAHEIGFYSVPDFMTMEQGDLTHFAPMRSVMSIESWVHVYFASIIFSNFARAGRLDRKIESSVFTSLRLLWRAILEQKQILHASGAIEIGKNCAIDPSAIITGPAKIGDNVSIGAGCVIDNCTIGDNVTIDAGCVMFQSTVANNCFLPFRSALYLTSLMENVIVAQNTCLQMCAIGRNSFIGAGSTFTDFNLIAQKPIRAADRDGHLQEVGQIVLGAGVGHNCRIGSGMVVFPGRMIESDVVLLASSQRRVIEYNLTFEESDHHLVRGGQVHKRFYPRQGERAERLEEDVW